MPKELDHVDAAMLMRMATGYLARYSASSRRLRMVLTRRVLRWHDKRQLTRPDERPLAELINATLQRLASLHLIDDDAYALGRARRLVAKGMPRNRVQLALAVEGLDARHEDVEHVLVEDGAIQARRYAERKRLGPFRFGPREPNRDKDIRRLIRAGFSLREAVAAIDASNNDEETSEVG